MKLTEALKLVNSKLEWPCRILISSVIILIPLKLRPDDPSYPEIPLLLLLISLWLYFYKLNLMAMFVLLYALVVIYLH